MVGLDIEAGSVAAAEVAGHNGSTVITGSGIVPLAPGAFREGEVADSARIAEALKELFSANRLSKRVRVGVANQRVVVRTMRLPAIEDPKEMQAAVRFQAEEQIPMPLDQAVLEHQVVGGVPAVEGEPPKVDLVVIAARREMIASFVEPVRRAGLEPVGVDLSAFGMIRALGEVGAVAEDGSRTVETILYCNVGDVMNLAVARGRSCLFTRVANSGLETIAARLATERGLSTEHAVQWLAHVGLETPIETVAGDPETVGAARRVLEEGAGAMVDDLRLSLDYYGAQEGAIAVDRIVVCGPGSGIAGLGQRMESGLGLTVSPATPSPLTGLPEAAASRLTLPFGLALEN
ncbi:MAG TPA: type IV pilus assembly protein PilM [Solirubrobacterales bacterium]